MDVFIGIVILLAGMAGTVFLVWNQYNLIKTEAYKKAPTVSPVTDDCIYQADKMLMFLQQRFDAADPNSVSDWKRTANLKLNVLRESHEVIDLARSVHLAGCHIVIEEVPEDYVEGTGLSENPSVIFLTDLKRAYEQRMERKYSKHAYYDRGIY